MSSPFPERTDSERMGRNEGEPEKRESPDGKNQTLRADRAALARGGNSAFWTKRQL